MKICCVSDLHGNLPNIPDCDLLLIAGDLCPNADSDLDWLKNYFGPWLTYQSKRMKVIGIAGNHDFPFQYQANSIAPLDWTYLQDSGTVFRGLNIWGTPWQPEFFDWAFNATEEELEARWALIPDNTDVLIVHGPPHGYGDLILDTGNVGSPSLTARIREIKPKLVVTGHIHCAYGLYMIDETAVINAAITNNKNRMTRNPVMWELEPPV